MDQDLNRDLFNMKQEFCPLNNNGEFSVCYYSTEEPS